MAFKKPAERVPSHGMDHFGQRYPFDFARLQSPYNTAYPRSIWRHIFGWLPAEDCYALIA